MDSHTLELLGFDKVRAHLATYAQSSLGRDLALSLEPSRNAAVVRAELKLTSEMAAALEAGHVPPLGGLYDVRLVLRRAAIGTMLTIEQLMQVADTLSCTGAVYRYRSKLDERQEKLLELLSGIEDLGMVAKTIGGCIDGRGHVLDMASRELGIVRQKIFDLDEKVKNEIRRLLRDPELRKALSYPNATVHGDHTVLPVAVNHRHKVAGVVHRMSATGETLYVEPASVAAMSAERIGLKGEEDREVRKILRRLSQEVGRVAKPLGYAIEIMAKLDLISARGKYARDYHMTEPAINDEGRLWLREARHPLLEQLARTPAAGEAPRTIVPIDVRLGFGFNILVVTGPNTGGKTVALKTTGLIALMAQAGLMVPTLAGSALPVFQHVLADIGDEQSLEQSLSTFSSHISRIASIFEKVNGNSLVLLDELGAGTDPVEGAALGRAILDQLDSVGCRAIVTTHLGDLKTYAFNNPRAENGAVEFDVETLRPTYRLLIGQFGMSNALRIAKRLKLPPELLKRARIYLKKRKGKTGELARLQELRAEAEKAKVDAMAAKQEAEATKAFFEKEQREKDKEEARQAELKYWRERLNPNDVVHVVKFDARGRVVRVDGKKGTIMVKVGIGAWEVPFEEIMPAEDGE